MGAVAKRLASLLFFSQECLFFSQSRDQTRYWKGEIAMALHICWLDDLAKAKESARQTNKPVLLDFFNPQ